MIQMPLWRVSFWLTDTYVSMGTQVRYKEAELLVYASSPDTVMLVATIEAPDIVQRMQPGSPITIEEVTDTDPIRALRRDTKKTMYFRRSR